MVRERLPRVASGFSVAELLIVLGVVALLSAISLPAFLTSWKNATLRGGAQEVVGLLHAGRQLAIKENQTVCVKGDAGPLRYGAKLRYVVGSCSAATFCSPGVLTSCIWRGPGTDLTGYLTLANAVEVKPPASDVTFTPLGAASGGTFHVCNPAGAGVRAVITVAASGRIATTYEQTGC